MKMIIKQLMLSFALLFVVACGSGDSNTNATAPSQPQVDPSPVPPAPSKAITIYVHGFSKTGYKRVGIYGAPEAIDASEESKNIVGFSTNYQGSDTNFDENIIISTSYYGDQAPDYYTEQDIQDVNSASTGIPRYAMIVAKYAKQKMIESGATKVNFLSVSMGSLVTRWLIEKNLENLAAQAQIGKWFSAEGVVAGNYVASEPVLKNISGIYEDLSPEVEHMSYTWVDQAFGTRTVGSSVYYKDIQIGFESSTKDDAMQGLLSKYLLFKGTYYANDGYQLVNDTFFKVQNPANYYHALTPTQSYFHQNHTDLKENIAAWSQASLFFTSKRRVKITLTHARVDELYDDASQASEVVFASEVHSPYLQESANITEAIDRRDIDSGVLSVYLYNSSSETKILNQNIFDAFVDPQESILTLNIDGYEIDNSIRYNIKEGGGNTIEEMGGVVLDIPLTDGIYEVSGENWVGEVKVEIFNY